MSDWMVEGAVRLLESIGFLWWTAGPADTTAAARTAIASAKFFICNLLSADESGGHMLTRYRDQTGRNLKIFGFQNKPRLGFRGTDRKVREGEKLRYGKKVSRGKNKGGASER